MTENPADRPTDREALLVELVDDAGRAIGTSPVALAHQAPGQLHRAFSVLLFDDAGRVLLQRRAAVKTRFPLLWANTCCGHPAPGETVVDAAAVRLDQELGLTADLVEAGVFRYQAADGDTGRAEHEWDHVVIGKADGAQPRPDPAEVADVAWVDPDVLRVRLCDDPGSYSPWLASVLQIADRSHHLVTR
ncbi:isopentenyl-diphosphate Delta-isomerase [Nocardia takedensis]